VSEVDREVASEPTLPRKNGELVFNAPWEGRAFGMAIALRQSEPYAWAEFRDRLERELAAAGPEDDGTRYYERWVAAFERLLEDKGLLGRAELRRRTREYLDGIREEVF